MSNRRRPRCHAVHDLHVVDDVRDVLADLSPYRCPDCNSEFGKITEYAEQVVSVEVFHDAICPWLARAARR